MATSLRRKELLALTLGHLLQAGWVGPRKAGAVKGWFPDHADRTRDQARLHGQVSLWSPSLTHSRPLGIMVLMLKLSLVSILGSLGCLGLGGTAIAAARILSECRQILWFGDTSASTHNEFFHKYTSIKCPLGKAPACSKVLLLSDTPMSFWIDQERAFCQSIQSGFLATELYRGVRDLTL